MRIEDNTTACNNEMVRQSPTDCGGSGIISGEMTLTMTTMMLTMVLKMLTMMTTKLKQSDSEGTGY